MCRLIGNSNGTWDTVIERKREITLALAPAYEVLFDKVCEPNAKPTTNVT